MARDGFDLSKLDDFTDSLIQASKDANKVQEKFLRDQGSKLARKTKQRARVEINKTAVNRKKYTREAGHYHKSIKRGKVYKKDGAQQVRVYSGDPVGHLIEDGWTPKLRNGKLGGHQDGENILAASFEAFVPQFEKDSEEMIDEMIRKI